MSDGRTRGEAIEMIGEASALYLEYLEPHHVPDRRNPMRAGSLGDEYTAAGLLAVVKPSGSKFNVKCLDFIRGVNRSLLLREFRRDGDWEKRELC